MATGEGFIAFLNFNLQFIAPTEAEQAVLEQLAPIGVGAGKPFDRTALSDDMQAALAAGVKAAVSNIANRVADISVLAGDTADGYGGDWLQRAATTQMGWGANSGEEASYPSYVADGNGEALDASGASYQLVFSKGQQPPVNAFWSLTMYDAITQLMIENPLDRYLLNSPMLNDMALGEDVALTLYSRKTAPARIWRPTGCPPPMAPSTC